MSNKYNKIKEIVAKVFGISVDDISTKSRKRKYVNARCIYSYILYDKNILRNYSEIGRLIGKDHSTVINCIRNHEDFFATDSFYQSQYKEVLKLVTTNVLNHENFDLMGLFKRIEINKRCEPCTLIA